MDTAPVPGNAGAHHEATALTDQDRAILGSVESALANGIQLKKWWEQTDATHSYAHRFQTTSTFNRPDHSFAFFDQAPLHGQTLQVMGDVMDLFYDRPKAPAEARAAWMQEQIREFILHYFMRVSDFRRPQAYISAARPTPAPLFQPFSWCPDASPVRQGFGYAQLYYKLRESGRVGKFSEEERFAIVDVRELEQKYEWIVLRIRIFDFNLTFRPLGSEFPEVVIPLRAEQQWAVVSRAFILHEDHPEPGVLGQYGYGYAVIKAPTDKGLLAYGPEQFDAGFQLFHFRVLDSGEVRVKLVFVVNRPERILNLSLNPVTWSLTLADLVSFGLSSRLFASVQGMLTQLPFRGGSMDPVLGSIAILNWLTGGLAARELCISRDDLEKEFLVQHFMQNYDLIVGSLQTWRQIPNWLDSAGLPEWVVKGVSA